MNAPYNPIGAPLSVPAKMPCLECGGAGEAEYMGVTEDRYHWRDCHVCDGTGLVAPYCETCEGKLTVDGFCYACEEYGEGFVYVERIAPGRIAV